MKLGELAREVGFPPGVLNVLPGYGAPTGEALARHPGVDKIAFTGSVRTARRLLHASADTNLKKLTLELGGKSPQVVFADADMPKAVEACFWGIFGNKGEVCNAGSRVLVHGKAHDAFVEKLVARAQEMVVGDPLDAKTEMGAQVSQQQLETILRYIESGKSEGATAACGGERDTRGRQGEGQLPQAHRLHRRAAAHEHRAGGDLRPGALGACASTTRRRRCGWRTGRATGWRRASGPATWRGPRPGQAGPGRRGVDQLLQRVRRRRALRWVQGVGLGPGPVRSTRSRTTPS